MRGRERVGVVLVRHLDYDLVLDRVLEEVLDGVVHRANHEDRASLLDVAHAGRGGPVDRLVWRGGVHEGGPPAEGALGVLFSYFFAVRGLKDDCDATDKLTHTYGPLAEKKQ